MTGDQPNAAAPRDTRPGKSAQSPLPLRSVSSMVGAWIGKLGEVWVEGQLTQVNRRPGTSQIYATLRDLEAALSMSLVMSTQLERSLAEPMTDGQRVIVRARVEFWNNKGSLNLRAMEIRAVGLGELLLQIEKLKGILRSEGLFERKRPLPFLPRKIGLVVGRESAALRDVLKIARERWPQVEFEIREVAVQGPTAATAVTAALRELDADPDVDVIIVTRGGGSVEDLLPFSDEGLVRAVAAAVTPVISAIGHEQDQPLLDFVADARASTPTNAAEMAVPNVVAERQFVADSRLRARRALLGRIDGGQGWLDGIRQRQALADPMALVRERSNDIELLSARSRRAVERAYDTAVTDVSHLHTRVVSLSPEQTLRRGYAVVQTHLITNGRGEALLGPPIVDPAQASPGSVVAIRVHGGRFTATVGNPPGPTGPPRPNREKPAEPKKKQHEPRTPDEETS